MPDDTNKPQPSKTPRTDPGAGEELAEETPTNYDGLPPPGLPKPPGQEKPPG